MLQWMKLSGYQEAAFDSFYTSRPLTSLLLFLPTPATGGGAAVHLSSYELPRNGLALSCLLALLLLFSLLYLLSLLSFFLSVLHYK